MLKLFSPYRVAKICVLALIAPAPSLVAAQLLEGESDGADRMRIASQLPTLTQQVAAASCAVTSNVDVEAAQDTLVLATAQFDHYIAALRDGDVDLHILEPELHADIRRDIQDVVDEWQAIHGAIDSIIIDSTDVDGAHVIDSHNLKLLDLTSTLSSDVIGKYARPFEIAYSDAMLLDIAGRQRMLTQKMAKDACEIWTGYHSEEAKVDLSGTMETFGNTLNALRFGLPEVGIAAAPNPAIEKDLDDLLARWDILKPNLQALVDGQEINEGQKYEVFHDLGVELAELDHLLVDYKEFAERRQ